MTGVLLNLPPLPTLSLKPTWVNRAGSVDRTACVEIRAGELWPHADFREVKRHPIAGETSYLEAVATITLGARFLHKLHVDRNPLTLQGDWRTSKSNAMKRKAIGNRHEAMVADERYPFDAEAQRRAYERFDGAFVRDHPLPAGNPNRGAPFTSGGKQIGLMADWTQTIAIERWRLHERLGKHYLRCPNSHKPLAIGHKGGKDSETAISDPSSPYGISLMAYGFQSHACQGKALKLFLPVCSIQEANDSELAEGWVNLVDGRYSGGVAPCRPMPPEVIEMRYRLLQRYGVLFRGRRLVCRKCLGVRYGEVRKPKNVDG